MTRSEPSVTEYDIIRMIFPSTIDQLADQLQENFMNIPFNEENSEWEQQR